jgi:hypothetical protein
LGTGANQNREIQSEGGDAFGQLPDPIAAVRLGTFWLAFQLVNAPPDHCQGHSWYWRGFIGAGFHDRKSLAQINDYCQPNIVKNDTLLTRPRARFFRVRTRV